MKQVQVGKNGPTAPAVILGCMRLEGLEDKQVRALLEKALELGCSWFDHADIYGGGVCHRIFAKAAAEMKLEREKIVLQSKCGIRPGLGYDSSRAHILASVDRILSELNTDYLDLLLLHRPDALMEPEEVADAFSRLEEQGKVRRFGVSNYRTGTIRLLQNAVKQPLAVNQLQFSLAHAGLVRAQMEANVESDGACDRDGGVLDFCRLGGIAVQAWSPFQYGMFSGTFLDDPKFPELNRALAEVAEVHSTTKTAVAAAWVLRHPALAQLVAGTTRPERLEEICRGAELRLQRSEWYKLYQAAGNTLP